MYVIYPDTNSLFGDHYWQGPRFEILKALGSEYADVEVWLSPVVRAELARHRLREIEELKSRSVASMRKFRELTNDSEIETKLSEYHGHIDRVSQEVSERYFTAPWLTLLEWPQIPVQTLVERDLGPQRPFAYFDPNAKRPESKGLRDAVIWEGLLTAMASNQDDTFIFVTEDRAAFVDTSTKSSPRLAPELMAEASERGLGAERIVLVPDIVSAQRYLEPLLQQEGHPRDFLAYALIMEWAAEESQRDLAGPENEHPEFRDGFALDFHIGLDTEGDYEGWNLDVHSAAAWPDSPDPSWSLLATVTFSTFVFKGDYFSVPDEEFGGNEFRGETNDHYFEIEVERELQIEVRVDTSSKAVAPVKLVSAKVLLGS